MDFKATIGRGVGELLLLLSAIQSQERELSEHTDQQLKKQGLKLRSRASLNSKAVQA